MDIRANLILLNRHLDHVSQNCNILGDFLLNNGEEELGLELIVNGYKHDLSKFSGIEWKYLNEDTKANNPDLFHLALEQHTKINDHHPEKWGGIKNMPRIFLLEMAADWKSRSEERGNNIMEYLKDRATSKFNFSPTGGVYKELKKAIEILISGGIKS